MSSTNGSAHPIDVVEYCPSYTTTLLPCINEKTHIIGVCAPTTNNDKTNNEYFDDETWMFNEFYTLEAHYRGQGASQTWLAAERLSGPRAPTRLAGLTELDPANLHTEFLAKVANVTEAAKQTGGSVTIFFCGTGALGHHLLVAGHQVTISTLQNTVENFVGVPVCLVRTALITPGWEVTVDLNKHYGEQSPDKIIIHTGTAPAFVSATLESLTKRNAEYIEPNQNYDDDTDDEDDEDTEDTEDDEDYSNMTKEELEKLDKIAYRELRSAVANCLGVVGTEAFCADESI